MCEFNIHYINNKRGDSLEYYSDEDACQQLFYNHQNCVHHHLLPLKLLNHSLGRICCLSHVQL